MVGSWIANNPINKKVKVKSIDLYDLIIDYLVYKNYLDKYYVLKKKGLSHLETVIRRLIELNDNNGWLVKIVKELSSGYELFIVHGIGKIFLYTKISFCIKCFVSNIDNIPAVFFYIISTCR